ncbi:MAG: AAA family ATPase [Planctomycetales bacterium]
MAHHEYEFFQKFSRKLSFGCAQVLIMCGDIYDLYFDGKGYSPLVPFLTEKLKADDRIQVIFEMNQPIRVIGSTNRLKLTWVAWQSGGNPNAIDKFLFGGGKVPAKIAKLAEDFDRALQSGVSNPTFALEFLRQLTIASHCVRLPESLFILVEGADLLLPVGNGDAASLTDVQLRRLSIAQDWFNDPQFLNGNDCVCLLAESRSLIHPRVSKLPQNVSIEVPPPSREDRLYYIESFLGGVPDPPRLWGSKEDLAALTATLSIHALRQLLIAGMQNKETITAEVVIQRVEEFIQSPVGEDVIEFKKPSHTLDDVVGASGLMKFLREELLPRFKASGESALAGAAVAGAIGSGKTFLFEAVAGELDAPVMVLKNVRSQWYGQTEVVFERLRRVLEALEKVVIFVDEADTQFGSIDRNSQATERRLTGKIQAMMSDLRLRGRVFWLLMTARIHQLSPDIRRPGRVGDLIIPVLDPEGDDRKEFLQWVLRGVADECTSQQMEQLDQCTQGYSPAAFASLRSRLKAANATSFDAVKAIAHDQISPDIGLTRRYQTLQALVNCSRRSLLPDPTVSDEERESWKSELHALEAEAASKGVVL